MLKLGIAERTGTKLMLIEVVLHVPIGKSFITPEGDKALLAGLFVMPEVANAKLRFRTTELASPKLPEIS